MENDYIVYISVLPTTSIVQLLLAQNMRLYT